MTGKNTKLPLDLKAYLASHRFFRVLILIILTTLVFVLPINDDIINKHVSSSITSVYNRKLKKKKGKKIVFVLNSSNSADTEFYQGIFPNMTQNLVDFAVAGFPKCGTTLLLRGILGASPHISYRN